MNLPVIDKKIPAMTPHDIERVRELERELLACPEQIEFPTEHVFHAGMYARTIVMPAGCVMTGALIKRATMLILSGDAVVFYGQDVQRLSGYHVLPASAGRKQAFIAVDETRLTMLFPTTSQSVDEAEREFTDEYELLASHHCENRIVITGE